MTARKPHGLIAAPTLDAGELRRVRALRDACDAREGLRLKLDLSPGDASRPPGRLLYFDRGTLVGYAALDRGDTFYEYQARGIPEYWLIDPRAEHAGFISWTPRASLRLSSSGRMESTTRKRCQACGCGRPGSGRARCHTSMTYRSGWSASRTLAV